MSDDRATRVAIAFARAAVLPTGGWCSACVEVLGVTGAGITVLDGDRSGPLCVSDRRMAALEDYQFTTGEGPCRDAFESRLPVFVEQLDGQASTRWPAFIDLAVAAGFASVFAYPLSTNGVAVGVLTLYQDGSGPLDTEQQADSLVVAQVLTETVLSLGTTSADGLDGPLDDAVAYRAQIHQASGMVAVQLGVPTWDAIARIRAHAFATGIPISVVATEIVGRRLRLVDDVEEIGDGP